MRNLRPQRFLLLLNYFCSSLAVPGGVWARADRNSGHNVGSDISHLSDMRVATVAARDARDVKYLICN